MVIINSAESKANRPLMHALDDTVFPAELIYIPSTDLEHRAVHPMSIYASALTDDRKQMIAYISMTVVNESYYRRLLKGEVKEEDFDPWDEKDTPLLFVRNLVVKDRRATPYIFRYAIKDLQQLFNDYELYVHRAFTIASHWATRRALTAYGFKEVGTYQGRYPILLASRDESFVLNSLLKRYQG